MNIERFYYKLTGYELLETDLSGVTLVEQPIGEPVPLVQFVEMDEPRFFRCISGSITLKIDGLSRILNMGNCWHVPAGQRVQILNNGWNQSRLEIITNGRKFADFLRESGMPKPGGVVVSDLENIGLEHGITVEVINPQPVKISGYQWQPSQSI